MHSDKEPIKRERRERKEERERERELQRNNGIENGKQR